jgi:hypothetical protein
VINGRPFGYLPYVDDLEELGDLGAFERGLVLGGEAGFVFEKIREIAEPLSADPDSFDLQN